MLPKITEYIVYCIYSVISWWSVAIFLRVYIYIHNTESIMYFRYVWDDSNSRIKICIMWKFHVLINILKDRSRRWQLQADIWALFDVIRPNFRGYWMIIEDQACSTSYNLAPATRPPPALPLVNRPATHRKTEKERQLSDGSGVRGVGRSQIIRKKAWFLYKSSILSGSSKASSMHFMEWHHCYNFLGISKRFKRRMKDLDKEMFAKYLETYHFLDICIQRLFSELKIADFMLI